MRLSDWITPTTPAGTALFLTWNGHHVFSIPHRELVRSPHSVRFSGVGGKRSNSTESFIDCAWREGIEEIGNVITSIDSASQTHLFRADGSLTAISLTDEAISPRLVLEKQKHTGHGSLAVSDRAYYLVAFDASLNAPPVPHNELAALIYMQDAHLAMMQDGTEWAIADLLQCGAQIECQAGVSLAPATTLIPHGTAKFLVHWLHTRSC